MSQSEAFPIVFVTTSLGYIGVTREWPEYAAFQPEWLRVMPNSMVTVKENKIRITVENGMATYTYEGNGEGLIVGKLMPAMAVFEQIELQRTQQ